jgi:hypothetical protein
MAGEILTLYTVYDKPVDHPDKAVVRSWLLPGDGTLQKGEAQVFDSLTEARASLPPGLVRLERHPLDEPQIVETWV